MPELQIYFSDLSDLETHIHSHQKGFILVTYRPMEGYPGMALAMMIVFDVNNQSYQLDLEYICLGLDLYGDTLMENYVYQFSDMDDLLAYLKKKYQIDVSDIPVNYTFDQEAFPNPIKNPDQKPMFEAVWQQFQRDFENELFLDKSLNRVG